MVIDDVEGADAAAVCQLVVHEVHGPALVGLGRLLQRLWRLPDKAFAWLDVVGRVFTIGKTAINLGCETYKATT